MAPLYDEEARAPLVGEDVDYVPDRPNQSSRGNGGLILNRVLIILTLVALVGVSVFFQMEQTQMTQQLASDEAVIQKLLSTVEEQGAVIQRFNQSVTNSDVLEQLAELEDTLNSTSQQLKQRLDSTVANVDKQLKNTMTELDETVKNAELEITSQVDAVKKNFDQYVVRTEDQFSMENSFMVYQLAGTFTLLSCLISMWHMTAHLRKMKQPVIQRKILAILWMSPIYAITSWFSLVFPSAEGYLAIIKDAYEAYIIYQVSLDCLLIQRKLGLF